MTPAEFAAELASASATDKPVVVCTAPPFLYRVGHIPGSVLHGPASSPEGLNSLTAWADSRSRARRTSSSTAAAARWRSAPTSPRPTRP
ncbi:MAG: hypothetical protein MZV70_42870 [Desulfobacterales bacterium]|nr:hypothetical protein [Desulfobacterales bacterium]